MLEEDFVVTPKEKNVVACNYEMNNYIFNTWWHFVSGYHSCTAFILFFWQSFLVFHSQRRILFQKSTHTHGYVSGSLQDFAFKIVRMLAMYTMYFWLALWHSFFFWKLWDNVISFWCFHFVHLHFFEEDYKSCQLQLSRWMWNKIVNAIIFLEEIIRAKMKI